MGVITFKDFKGSKETKSTEEKVPEPLKIEEKVVPVTEENFVTEEKLYEEEISKIEEISGYKLYRDKQENFSCEISIEGAVIDSSSVRLIIESPEWNLLFNGTIDASGKCTIPIKKLPILSEGTQGKIKLEIIAEDTVFVPWEENFVVKNSKKVSVKIVEQESLNKPKVKFNKL